MKKRILCMLFVVVFAVMTFASCEFPELESADAIEMTEEEKALAEEVHWLNRSIEYNEETKSYDLSFWFKREEEKDTENYLKVPYYLDVTVTSKTGVVVYEETKRLVDASAYDEKNVSTTSISVSEFADGGHSKGTLLFKVYSPGYFNYQQKDGNDFYELSLFDLPTTAIIITTPSDLPKNLMHKQLKVIAGLGIGTYEDQTGVTINKCEHKESSNFVTITFEGTKRFDKDGSGSNSACFFIVYITGGEETIKEYVVIRDILVGESFSYKLEIPKSELSTGVEYKISLTDYSS